MAKASWSSNGIERGLHASGLWRRGDGCGGDGRCEEIALIHGMKKHLEE